MTRFVPTDLSTGTDVRKAVRDTRIPDALMGVLLTFDGIVMPGLGFAPSLFGVAGLAVISFTRHPVRPLGRYRFVAAWLGVLVVYLWYVSAFSAHTEFASDWTKRLVRIAFVLIVAIMIAVGRIDVPSLLRGVIFGLIVNVPAFLLGLTPRAYGDLLTGWLGDKNKAGMFYATIGVLAMWQARGRVSRLVLVLLFAVCIWFTGSRTSITAFALGTLWTWLLARRPSLVRLAGGLGAVQLLNYVEANFAQSGQFADRSGSDLLRGRIAEVVATKLAASPPQGLGLGEAYVTLQGSNWYFHDSYATLRVEGGWFYLITVVTLTVLFGMRPMGSSRSEYEGMVAQGATIAILVCATKLGEVFLTIPWALTFGVALNYVLKVQNGEAEEEAPSAADEHFTEASP